MNTIMISQARKRELEYIEQNADKIVRDVAKKVVKSVSVSESHEESVYADISHRILCASRERNVTRSDSQNPNGRTVIPVRLENPFF